MSVKTRKLLSECVWRENIGTAVDRRQSVGPPEKKKGSSSPTRKGGEGVGKLGGGLGGLTGDFNKEPPL